MSDNQIPQGASVTQTEAPLVIPVAVVSPQDNPDYPSGVNTQPYPSVTANPVNPADPPQYPRITEQPQTVKTYTWPASLLTGEVPPSGSIARTDPDLNPGYVVIPGPTALAPTEPPCYIDHAAANRESAITHLEGLLADMPPVSSITREYAETRSDLIFAIHNLKQGRK